MSRDADVLVVGAGPAGATAARTLAVAGVRVLLLDRARFPRPKPCGGAISARALDRFPYLQSALHRISTHWVSRLHLESPRGEAVTLTSGAPAVLLIRRVEFDQLLVSLAGEAGARLIEGAEVCDVASTPDEVEVRLRDGRRLAGRLAIGADGVNSVVARRTGLNPGWPNGRLALDMMEETPDDRLRARDPDALWVSYGHGDAKGYAYIFPKCQYVNIGNGYLLSHFRNAIRQRPYEIQQRLIGTLRDRGAVNGTSSQEHFRSFLIPVGGPLSPTMRNRVLLAGDAGGFVNGFTAEGIFHAMVSGELAGRAAAEAIASDGPTAEARQRSAQALAGYEAAWRREIGAELRDSVLVQRFLFRDTRRIDQMVAGARRHPTLTMALVRCAMGQVPYRAVRRRLLARFPLLAARLIAIWALDTRRRRPVKLERERVDKIPPGA